MDIRFYNFNFELLHIEPDIISSNWTVFNNNVGGFEIHFPIKTEIASLIAENCDICRDRMLVVIQGDLQGIVTSFIFGEDIAIFGKTCNWLLEKRVVTPFKSTDVSGDALSCADIARVCAQKAFYDVEEFEVAPTGDFTPVYSAERQFWRNVCHPLENVISDIMKENGGGHFLYFDRTAKKWVLNFTKNRQTDFVLSICLGTAVSQEYFRNADTYAADGWFEEEVFDSEGLLTGFKWNKISKNEKSGIYRFETILENESLIEAETALSKKIPEDGAYMEGAGYNFGKDFFLGDIVCVQYEFGDFRADFRRVINGVSLGFEEGRKTVHVDFKEV